MPEIQNKKLILLFCASFFALAFAYISQFVFDYQPCILCLYQRIPFWIILTISAIAFFSKNNFIKKIILIFSIILLITNTAIASYHVGVEQKIFKGFDSCSSQNLEDITDLEELKTALLKTKAVRCDEPEFFFLKLSMAAWNVIYCLLLLIYSIHQNAINHLATFARSLRTIIQK